MAAKIEAVLERKIGKRMREIRKQKKITLIELSKITGVAQATLSRMETGQMLGTVESHQKIAEALGISLSDLYEGIDRRVEAVRQSKAAEPRRVVLKNDSVRAELLTPNISSKKIVPILVTLSANGKTPMDRGERGVDKFVWVVDGEIQVAFDNATYDLSSNDTLYFEASAPHQFINKRSQQSKLLVVGSK